MRSSWSRIFNVVGLSLTCFGLLVAFFELLAFVFGLSAVLALVLDFTLALALGFILVFAFDLVLVLGLALALGFVLVFAFDLVLAFAFDLAFTLERALDLGADFFLDDAFLPTDFFFFDFF